MRNSRESTVKMKSSKEFKDLIDKNLNKKKKLKLHKNSSSQVDLMSQRKSISKRVDFNSFTNKTPQKSFQIAAAENQSVVLSKNGNLIPIQNKINQKQDNLQKLQQKGKRSIIKLIKMKQNEKFKQFDKKKKFNNILKDNLSNKNQNQRIYQQCNSAQDQQPEFVQFIPKTKEDVNCQDINELMKRKLKYGEDPFKKKGQKTLDGNIVIDKSRLDQVDRYKNLQGSNYFDPLKVMAERKRNWIGQNGEFKKHDVKNWSYNMAEREFKQKQRSHQYKIRELFKNNDNLEKIQ